MRDRLKCTCVFGVVSLLAASSAAPALYAANMKPVHAKINAALASGNAAQRASAVRQIAAVLRQGTHYACPTRLRYNWLPALMNDKDYPAAAKLARLGILLNPSQTSNVVAYQEYRVQALLAMGKPNAALRNAKSLFDVCTMPRTANAVLLLAKCLRAQGPDGVKREAQFRRQQLSGENMPPAGGPVRTCPVLAAIKINARPYVKAAAIEQSGRQVWTLIGKGNLLLLAGKPAAARHCFNEAYDIAGNKDLPGISERIASSIRAADGTIGGANRWVMSIRRRKNPTLGKQ